MTTRTARGSAFHPPAPLTRRAILAGTAAAAVAGHAGSALAQETLKIGVLGTITGPGATWGLGIDGGARIAADEVNARGGLKVGGKAYKVEIVSYDDQYRAAAAVTAINRLIGPDGVRFVLGPIGSASLLAIKPITEREKVLLFTASWSAEVLKDSRYIFRVGPTTQEFAPATVAWLKQNRPQVKRVATLSANDETGWNSQRIQKAAYAAGGLEIVAAEHFERQQNDFRALLTKLLAARPDSIELDTTPPPTAGLVVRQAREQGFKGGFTKFGGFDVAELVRTAGADNAEGVIGILLGDPASAEWAKLQQAYARHHSNAMGDFVVPFYDSARLLFHAIEASGTVTDSDKVVAALEKSAPFRGAVGELTWGGKAAYGVDHQIYGPVFLTEIVKGKGNVIGKVALV
ncbi:ABC transporter substrate-binding protein [Enterovirga rhinocerotis]|uniref:Amino acid/amide ABC transporter substrate-binding protein (HAAT family) n=1 Tax=Enterovirga rhinocerotis TaxID=1339210 RepID=A0A4R7BLY2_9HYPH|nr:ABC transporter substrate-binding protein [Enterovirga rhinocerotis]TDR85265.1 amino acid/amide ABC transporter substrate-binding protein (HAAT family) [Enterovirga rhinocerotis]